MQDNSKLICTFGTIITETMGWLGDFEKIMQNPHLKKEINSIDRVYMYMIIVNLSQIFNGTDSDKFGLKQIENCSAQEEKDNIGKIREDNKLWIEKIKNNRNWTITHVFWLNDKDKLFTGLRQRNRDGIKYYRQIPIPKEDKEIYNPQDLLEDLPKINNILHELDEIGHKLNLNDYKKLNKLNS